MTIASEIQRIQTNIANTYDALEAKGATMPATENSDNLASTVATISGGGGASDWYNWKNVTEGGIETSSGTMPSTQNWSILSNENGYVAYVYDSTNGSNIYAYSSDGSTWTQGTLPTTATWNNSASTGGMFFLFRNNSTSYLYSADGQTWSSGTYPVSFSSTVSVPVWCGSYFIIVTPVGSSGTGKIYYSADGQTWSLAHTSSTSCSFSNYGIANGNGITIVVGFNSSSSNTGLLFVSTDGQNWTESFAPSPGANVENVAFFKGNFYLFATSGTRKICYSSNGINWTTTGDVLPSDFTTYSYLWYSVNENLIILPRYNTTVTAYTTDGTTWASGTIPSQSSVQGNFLPYKKFFMFKDGNNILYTDTGSSWETIALSQSETWRWGTALRRINGDKVVIPSSSSTAEFIISQDTVTTEVYTDTQSPTTSSVVYDAPKVASTMTITSVGTGTITLSDTKVYTRNQAGDVQYPILGTKTITSNGTYTASNDGLDGYTEVEVDVPSSGSTITASNDTGASIQSGDKVWLQRAQGNYSILTTPVISANTFTGIAAENIATGSSGAVSAAVTPYVPSTFGLKDYGTLPSTYDGWRVLSNGIKYVAFQYATTQTVNAFAYSDDGKNWTSGTLPGNVNSWYRGTSSGGRFIIYDYSYYDTSLSSSRVVSSADGVNWTSGTYNGKFSPSSGRWTFGDGTWYSATSEGTSQSLYYLAYSTNGTSWIRLPQKYQNATIYNVVYGNNTLVMTPTNTVERAAYSTDGGVSWTNIATSSSGLPSNVYTLYCIFDGTKFIAFPYNNGTVTDMFTSTDGINWTKHTGALPFTNVVSIKYNNGLYWTYQNQGTLGAYSTDGINWTTVQDPIGSPGSVGIFGNYYVITPTASTPNEVQYSADGHNWDSLQLDSNVTWLKNVITLTSNDQRADKLLIPSIDSTAVAILGE